MLSARLELLHPYPLPRHINVLPLEQYAIFQALSGEPADDVQDADFGLVLDFVLRIRI